MYKKTETRVEMRFLRRPEPRLKLDDLVRGTYLVDADCRLYLCIGGTVVDVECASAVGMTARGELPKDFRVVPKVTFHVELDGEG